LVSLPLVELWDKRHLIFHFAILNIQMRFKTTYLGIAWTAIEPLLTFIVLYLVFTSIRDRQDDFAIYLISGIIFYHIFVRGTLGGVGSITNARGIIMAFNIKREFFPVVSTTTIGILSLVDIAVFFSLMPVFQFIPDWTLVLLPIPLILVLFLVLGMSYILSITAVFVKDVQHIWAIITFTLLFLSPIFWFVKDVSGFLLVIHQINPVGQIIEISHALVVYKEVPPLSDWLYTTVFVFAIFFVGYFVFQKFAPKVAEEL